jgi:hypothetical protein
MTAEEERDAQPQVQPPSSAAQAPDPGYRIGYEDGFATGTEIGRAWAEAEMAEAWREVATRVRRLANSPTYEELKERRNHYPQPDDRTPDEILAAARASWAAFEAEA